MDLRDSSRTDRLFGYWQARVYCRNFCLAKKMEPFYCLDGEGAGIQHEQGKPIAVLPKLLFCPEFLSQKLGTVCKGKVLGTALF